MHRWFFADDEVFCNEPTLLSEQTEIPTASSTSSLPDRNWLFKVHFNWKLCSNEFLAICGSSPSLGNWDVQFSVPLKRIENSSIWSLTVSLPVQNDIRYRYLIYALNCTGHKLVRFWETHFNERLINRYQLQDIDAMEHETFGLFNGKVNIERGWLNPYVTVVQFKFNRAPFALNTSVSKLLLQVKITPIKITDTRTRSVISKTGISECSNEKVQLSAAFAFCEVATLQDRNGEFRKQPKYGTICGRDHSIIFNVTLDVKEHTGYLIDLYSFALKSASDVPLNHFGYQYVLPQDLKNCEGTLQLVIMCATKHRPIGCMKCDYLVVQPMFRTDDFNLEKTFQRYWNFKRGSISIGHRGCGMSFWLQNNILRENTIKSLKSAIEHGADMVEFDVQLTKDMVPILWHDFHLCLTKMTAADSVTQEYDIMHLPLTLEEINALRSPGAIVGTDFINVPISRFTLEQLTRVEVYEPPSQRDNGRNCFSDFQNNRPFSTLEQVLKEIDLKTEFVIDIKWPQNFSRDSKKDFDKNEFVDSILHVVLKYAQARRIVFLSLDANICTMLRLKQNLYPIVFVIQTDSTDARAVLLSNGTYFANAMELLGICVNCLDILKSPCNVADLHERDMCVFTSGIQTRAEETRKNLKQMGVDGIICDRINQSLKPMDLKGNLFYIVPFENRNLFAKKCSKNRGK